MSRAKSDWLTRMGPDTAASAEEMIRAGVVVGVDDWVLLGQASREIFVHAGNLVRAETAALSGLAAQGPDGYAIVAGQVDEGESVVRLALSRESRRIVEDIGTRSPVLLGDQVA